MKYINASILKILSRASDLLQLDRTARKVKATVQNDHDCGGTINRNKTRAWKLLPSIWKFEIEKGLFDWLLLLFGYLRRSYTKMTFYGWKNGKANAYLDYMFTRLEQQVKLKDYLGASKTMHLLMTSSSYRVSAFNYVAKGWYKNMNFAEVQRTLKEIRRLAKTQATRISFKRVYIPKSDGSARPLGVPTLAWRVYLHMLNNIIVTWRLPSEMNNQHGYLPKRSTITAWENLMRRIDEAPNIYEADLTKFFDSVTHKGLRNELEIMGLPGYDIEYIDKINKSLVKLTKEDQIQEPDRNIPFHADGKTNEDALLHLFSGWLVKTPDEHGNWNTPRAPRAEDFAPSPRIKKQSDIVVSIDDLLNETFEEEEVKKEPTLRWDNAPDEMPDFLPPLIRYKGELYEPDELIHIRSKELEDDLLSINMVRDTVKEEGVPQGAPTSCSLATLSLRPLERAHGDKVLFFADDIILFPSASDVHPPDALNLPYYGLKCNESKSRWAKIDGEWIVDSLKFVGMRYIPRRRLPLFTEHFLNNLLLFLALDLLLIGYPLFSGIWLILNYNGIKKLSRPRFQAATRSGSTLEFTNKEAFLAYLNNARTWLLNTSATSELQGERLESWILGLYPKFEAIQNPVKLWVNIFGSRTITVADKIKLDRLSKKNDQIPKRYNVGDIYQPSLKVPHVNLTGWFAARMYYNSWTVDIPQDFRLKWRPKSWIGLKWDEYRKCQSLKPNTLTTFTASSFAVHYLLNQERLKRKKLRRVLTNSSQ